MYYIRYDKLDLTPFYFSDADMFFIGANSSMFLSNQKAIVGLYT
jgi:hypothetical protein